MLKVVKDNLDTIMKWASILFLFAFSLHLFDFSDKYIIVWCVFSIAIFWLQNKELCLDKIFWVLSLAIILNGLGTYYYLRENLSYTWKNIIEMVVPTVLVYPFIKQLAWKKKEVDIETILLAIVVGTFVYSMLNYYALITHGFAYGGRIWVEFWTNYPMNATHHSYWGCFIAGMCGYVMYCFSERKWVLGILFSAMIVMENIAQIAAENRMVLCVTLVAAVVGRILYFIFNINNKKRIRNMLLLALTVILVLAVGFILNIGGIRTSEYVQSFLTRDGGILKNIRFQMIFEAIKMLPSHWKGGADMYAAGVYWVHNYWLQVANVSGIIPFVLWVIVNISVIIDVVKLIKNPCVSNPIKYMMVPVLASVTGYLMMEPGGTESNRYIIFYVILIALLKQLANRDKTNAGVEDVQVSSEI